MKNKPAIVLAACVLAAGIPACTPDNASDDSKELHEQNETDEQDNNLQSDSQLEESDTQFAVVTADGGLLEVHLGELAQWNGNSEEVKSLGQMMVDDHSKANLELNTLALRKSISLPTKLSDKNQKEYDDLADKTGVEFDKAYAAFMVDDHKKDIAMFSDQAEKGKDAELKAWASDKIPTLEHHLEAAEQAAESVNE